ncbi:MAG: hypothetical protein BMS9Abin15_0621 [Gammaproteobacteria bacterium]|nr:MAG: hypothetical protein BMS9Abin15_0621 [Gammaproteobacteria bacterium]
MCRGLTHNPLVLKGRQTAFAKELIQDNQPEDEDKAEDGLRCSECTQFITSAESRITVAGSHEHHCTNPHGVTFAIGCFGHAPGCTGVGSPTLDHTWFPGYRWRITLCSGCSAHLGWIFEAADGNLFFGLILDRLLEEQ